MWSGSVIVSNPFFPVYSSFPVPRLIIAKFLRSSQPIAPQPTMNVLQNLRDFSNPFPIADLIPSSREFYGLNSLSYFSVIYFSYEAIVSSSPPGIISMQSEKNSWFVGKYLWVMALTIS